MRLKEAEMAGDLARALNELNALRAIATEAKAGSLGIDISLEEPDGSVVTSCDLGGAAVNAILEGSIKEVLFRLQALGVETSNG